MDRLSALATGTIKIPAMGRLPQSVHVLSEAERLAIVMALTTRRALLVRGEPGTGKSQLARAAATVLRRPFVRMVVDARTEPGDLHWHYDRVRRLATAQMVQALGLTDADAVEEKVNPRHFVSPGPLWWALDWTSAVTRQQWTDKLPPGWQPGDGVVLLIDEIDKADGSVPSGLLSALGEGVFTAPDGTQVGATSGAGGTGLPLVVVTTNEERMLPDAFVRRCLVLHIDVPTEKNALIEWLLHRGRAHFDRVDDELLIQAATLAYDMRVQARQAGAYAPGLAEYLDLVRAVCEWPVKRESERGSLLNRLAKFALDKHPRELI